MLNPQDLNGKKILIRADLDLPIKDGRVENLFRLKSLLPTLKLCLENNARVCLIGHLGRPSGIDQSKTSLAPVIEELKRLINQDIILYNSGFSPGDWWKGESPIVALENLRWDKREESLSREFAIELSQGADIYIYEAFATYRPCTSLNLIPEVLPTLTGLQFDLETSSLLEVLHNPERPSLLIASGAKEDKLALINSISGKFDNLFLGGKFALPQRLTDDGLDVNEQGVNEVLDLISKSKTIVMNGPLGRYEDNAHSKATKAVLEALTTTSKKTILGGGDTISAIPQLGFDYTQYGFVSTGGGAMLEYLLSETHPLLEVLKNGNLNHG